MEALSIISEARTFSVLEQKIPSSKSKKVSTGTGTDCIVLSSNLEGTPLTYSGKHTILGELIGKLVIRCISEGIQKWKKENYEQYNINYRRG